ncbi:hypothetical protein lerEdw1_019664 [Lerista edwardsae]|nr:hypothetical protein lerEdw1_019664 [Lerista edwardsae]
MCSFLSIHSSSRTLTDLLKQPGHGPSDLLPDGHIGSVQVQIGDGLSRGSPRSSTGKRQQCIIFSFLLTTPFSSELQARKGL